MPRRIIGWRMVRPRRPLAGLGLTVACRYPQARVMYDPANPYTVEPFWWPCPDAPPQVTSNGAPSGAVQIPIPGGSIGVTVTQAGQPAAGGAVVPAGAVDRVKTWLQEKSLVAGYENWKTVAFGAGVLWLVRK